MKWALVALFTLGALGAWAMGLQSASTLSAETKPLTVPKVAMRPLPQLQGGPAIAAAAPKAEEPAKAAEPAAKPPEPAAKPAEPVAAAKPPEPAKTDVAAPAKQAEPPKTVAPTPQPKPKPAPPPQPASDEGGSPPPPAPAAAAPAGEGSINLKASDTAEVVVDGRKLGPSPKLGVKLKAGKHKIRFDCYDENGNLKPGKVQTVDIKPDEEQDLDYECPFSQ
jgi:outer membrane biosynthesis protein TonB